MKHWTKILKWMLVLLTPAVGLGNPRVIGKVDFQITGFDREWGLAAGSGVGGGVLAALTPSLLAGMSAKFSRTHQPFAVVGGEAAVAVRAHQVLLNARILLGQWPRGFVLAFEGGAGVLKMIRPAQTISLGALGSTTLGAVRRSYFVYECGMALMHRIRGRLGARLALQFQGVPDGGIKINRIVQGGLDIVLL